MANFIRTISRTSGFRYVIVGLLGNLLNFIIYIGLLQFIGSIFYCSLAAYLMTLIFTYIMSINWTFDNPKAMGAHKRWIAFVGVYGSSAVIMASTISLLTKYGLDYRISWLFGACYALLHNFLLSKFWIFKK